MNDLYCVSGSSPTTEREYLTPASVLARIRDVSQQNHDELPCGTFCLLVFTTAGYEPLWCRVVGRWPLGLLGRVLGTSREIRFTPSNVLRVGNRGAL